MAPLFPYSTETSRPIPATGRLEGVPMRLRSFFCRSMSRGWLAPVLLAVAMTATTGCEDKHIGRPCDLLADGGMNKTTFNGSALECPTRICVQPATHPQNPETDTQALCTAECSTNEDCEEAEGRNKSKTGDFRCQTGFA